VRGRRPKVRMLIKGRAECQMDVLERPWHRKAVPNAFQIGVNAGWFEAEKN